MLVAMWALVLAVAGVAVYVARGRQDGHDITDADEDEPRRLFVSRLKREVSRTSSHMTVENLIDNLQSDSYIDASDTYSTVNGDSETWSLNSGDDDQGVGESRRPSNDE